MSDGQEFDEDGNLIVWDEEDEALLNGEYKLIQQLQSERDIYLDALKGIRDHEHSKDYHTCPQETENPDWDNVLKAAHCGGHRCCSKLASYAIEAAKKVK